ncbi:cyclase family protein, partial [Alphaproteobacteria bacterium]|nr:cyclase family protein [Alphaproteobacteria bacterium]
MPHKYNEKMFDIKHLRATAEKLKNWGRWGPDDEIGTLNFITPDKVIDAS